jgi:hypothetical protein
VFLLPSSDNPAPVAAAKSSSRQRNIKDSGGNTPDDNLVTLIDHLLSIDTAGSLAKLNTSSMSDNNGDRIKF